ncbi:uncharacterized protein L3040_000952 [Drepanopeziza brunnea f. sp. 'multigermtubi']|uniref:uncharacterized protein n=1 Tax=Drepanopeziza brunnea f. sp. 'multigermtubi' TaxID=698441 RepID=UPI0023A3CE55|nr:hypothetical protein L3040_000952 [Drepanopeziza brunnea f. sp. 'multigermtubi']
MMFINAFAVAITLVSPAVVAAPQPGNRNAFVQLCRSVENFECMDFRADPSVCTNIEPVSYRLTESLDTYGKKCQFYQSVDCFGDVATFDKLVPDLLVTDYPEFFHKINSFSCL